MRSLGGGGYRCSFRPGLWPCTRLSLEPHHRRYHSGDRWCWSSPDKPCGHCQKNELDCRLRWSVAYRCFFYFARFCIYSWPVERYYRWWYRLHPRSLGCSCGAASSWLMRFSLDKREFLSASSCAALRAIICAIRDKSSYFFRGRSFGKCNQARGETWP